MLIRSCILLVFCFSVSSWLKFALAVEEQSVSQTLEIISARGFGGEQFQIKSYDGWPLTVYHIINPHADPRTLNKYPVIIFHGLGGDATQMISHSLGTKARKPLVGQITAFKGDDCMAFMFSNNNYDVWLVDARGVNLNNRNASVDTNFFKSQQFWKYSLDEQVFNDAPKLIDFVLEQTQTSKALLVTYSESTFFMFALLSAVPDYANKVASLVAMAPTAYVSNLRGVAVPWMIPFLLAPENIDGNYAPQPMVDTIGLTARRLCTIKVVSSLVCRQISQAIVGKQESMGEATDFFSTLAEGSSIRVFKHFAQLSQQNRFGMYDYGPQMNLIKYRQATAPNYDLSKIKLPTIILMRGGNDFLSTEPDQERLIRELGTKPMMDIKLPSYNHLDFVLGANVIKDVNLPIMTGFSKVMLSDGSGTLIRDASLPLPTRTQQPDSFVAPQEKRGQIINTPIHTLRNLMDVLELKPTLGLIMPKEGGSRVTQGLTDIVDNFDRLAGTLNRVPDLIQAAQPQYAF